jgi:hypothetical protein
LVRPVWIERERRAVEDALLVEGIRLNPDWVRIERGESVTIRNSENRPATVVNKAEEAAVFLEGGTEESLTFPEAGIYQMFVETDGQTRSSFVIVEPVEDFP